MKTLEEDDYKNGSFFIIGFFDNLLKRKFTLVLFIIIFMLIGYYYTNSKIQHYDLDLKVRPADNLTETKFKILAEELQSEWTSVYEKDLKYNQQQMIFFHDRYSLLENFVNEISDNEEFINAISKIDHNYKGLQNETERTQYIFGKIANFKITKSEETLNFQDKEVLEINFNFKTNDITSGKKILKQKIDDSFLNFKNKLLADYKLVYEKIVKGKKERLKNFQLKLNYLENIIKQKQMESILYLESLRFNDSNKKFTINHKMSLSDIDKKINTIKNDITLNNFESYFVAKSLVEFLKIDTEIKKDFIEIDNLKLLNYDLNLIEIKSKNSFKKDIFIFTVLGLLIGVLYLIFEKNFLLYKKFKRQK